MTEPTKTIDRAPRKPTDRAPKKSDLAKQARPEGHDLLRPAIQLRSGQASNLQAGVLELKESLGFEIDTTDDGTDTDTNTDDEALTFEPTPDALRAIGKVGALLEEFAVDLEGYITLDTGPGSQERVMNLAFWYFNEVGEAFGSAT